MTFWVAMAGVSVFSRLSGRAKDVRLSQYILARISTEERERVVKDIEELLNE